MAAASPGLAANPPGAGSGRARPPRLVRPALVLDTCHMQPGSRDRGGAPGLGVGRWALGGSHTRGTRKAGGKPARPKHLELRPKPAGSRGGVCLEEGRAHKGSWLGAP